MNAVATEREAEEQEELYQLEKHRFHTYKMSFFAIVFALQSGDAVSDVATEGFYFFTDEGGGSGNGTASSEGELLKMSLLFDLFYAAHGIVSLIVSGFILQKIILVFQHLRNKIQQRKEQQPGGGVPLSESLESNEKPAHGSNYLIKLKSEVGLLEQYCEGN